MLIRNLTPFLFGKLATSREPPAPAMTLIVKGTFRLRPGEPVAPLEGIGAQLGLSGDVFADGDDDRRGRLLYPTDFADHKPRADILVAATCHTPHGKPLTECPVRVEVGSWKKLLRVVGQRTWVPGLLGDRPSEPRPFTSVPLDDTRAFGGPKDPRNPVGKGLGTDELFQIESPTDVVSSRGDRFSPAGLGPVSPLWADRASKVGKDYGERYQKTRAPHVSSDFDWSYHNASRPDQQIEGHLRGDEDLLFQNLHPRAALFSSRLPGLRIRAFVHESAGPDGAVRAPGPREVPMVLDTLWADLNAEVLILVWRGTTPVSEDDLSTVKSALVASERVSDPPRDAAEYAAMLEAHEKDPLADVRKPPPFDVAAAATPPSGDPLWDLFSSRLTGLPPSERSRVKATFDRLTRLSPGGGQVREALEKALAEGQRSSPPVVLPRKEGEVPYVPLGQSLARVKRLADTLFDQVSRASEGAPAAASAQGSGRAWKQKLDALSEDPFLRSVDPYHRGDRPADPPGPGADLSGCDLSDQDLSGVDLSGADLRGAILCRANLRGAKLRGAKLKHAILFEATIEGADLSGADLTLAHVGAVRGDKVDLRGSTLDQTVFQGAVLREAVLTEARGEFTTFSEADLTGARASGLTLDRALAERVKLAGADLSEAKIERSRFTAAEAGGAVFRKARLSWTSFTGADLGGAVFTDATGERFVARQARLSGADLSYVVWPEAFFDEADLRGANLFGADLRGARLYRASLGEVNARAANLFQADLRKSTLWRARFDAANLYGARMRGARTKGAVWTGANLTRAIGREAQET